jgi:hypothetical protein
MASDQAPIWYLKKHRGDEMHGPVPFTQIRGWAAAAQVNPHDIVSNDGKNWTKAPMVPELGMDWLVEVPGGQLYGPTTPDAVLEFLRMGEITPCTRVTNCCSGESMELASAPFFDTPGGGNAAAGLKKRIAELEAELAAANGTIASLRRAVGELESRAQA